MENNNNTIIFRMGEETGIVIEKTAQQFRDSIFKDHYVKALQLANDILDKERNQEGSSNIIAFCADRGEGKTSCMQSFAEMITCEDRLSSAINTLSPGKEYANITPKELQFLGLIDPAYFDEKHNIIELITGMMYESLCCKKNCDKPFDAKTSLIGKFREVQKTLEYIEKASNAESPVYDPLEKVQSLSKGLKLHDLIKELMGEYLSFIGKKHLVICIDDIDLNIQYAYRMTEQIRKYLSNKNCIILFATNVEQLTMVIRHSMEKDLYAKIIDGEDPESQVMAAKYVTKLLPTSHRINLVHLTDLYDRALLLLDERGKEEGRWGKVKDAISQLIYTKTRYLFYNNESETSPIVPKNLRSFRHLMHLLTSMPNFNNVQLRLNIETPAKEQIEDFHKGLENKTIFKNYFYQDWIAHNLNKADADFATTLVEYTDIAGINILVVQYLASRFGLGSIGRGKQVEQKVPSKKKAEVEEVLTNILKLSEEEQLENQMEERLEQEVAPTILSIAENQNRAYNVTIGDVFYLIAYLRRGYTSAEDKMLLYFIQSFYSMRLYECYDIITEQKGMLYPIREKDESRLSIYRVDDTFEHTNILQRLVNGSFCTYMPNEFMAFDSTKKMSRDLRLINAKEVKDLFKKVIDKYPTKENELTPRMKLDFQMCEFLCWTISRTAYAPKNEDLINAVLVDRKQITPVYYGDFRPKTSFYIFDIMAPFYNATNIKYAYNRINIGGEKTFYDLARENPYSLLNLAIRATLIERGRQGDPDNSTAQESSIFKMQTLENDIRSRVINEYDYYTMLSGAIVRNADVLIALRDHIVSRKNHVSKESGNTIELLSQFYKEIIRSEMYTYRTGNDDHHYEIRFSFLAAFVAFLNELIPTDSKNLNPDQIDVVNWLSNVLFAIPKKKRASNKKSNTKDSSKQSKGTNVSFGQKLAEELTNRAVAQVADTMLSNNTKEDKQ